MRATLETADAIGAEAVIFHPGSHLGDGLDAGLRRAVPALRELLELTTDRLWLLLENSRRRRRHDRPLTRRAGRARRCPRRSPATRCLYRLLPLVGVGRRRDATGRHSTPPCAELDRSIGLDRLRCLHVNDAASALGSNLDRHASVGEGLMGSRIDVFLAHPAFQGLPAILETPGPDGHGPDAEEVRRLRDLHRRGMRNARRRATRG